jgi:hypothetical protein
MTDKPIEKAKPQQPHAVAPQPNGGDARDAKATQRELDAKLKQTAPNEPPTDPKH